MKIAILSRSRSLYSTRRLREAGKARGHKMLVIDPLRCYMNIATLKPTVHFNGKPLEDLDAVIPRIGASITYYGTAVVRQFEMMGVFTLNESVAISRSRDKLRALQLLSRRGIGLPVTGFASSPDDTDDLLSLVGGVPVVVKLLEGTQGKGVVLAETRNAADGVIDAFRGLAADFLVQRFVQEASGSDIRCFVIGKKGSRGHATTSARRRVSLESASRRLRAPDQDNARKNARSPSVRCASSVSTSRASTFCAAAMARS